MKNFTTKNFLFCITLSTIFLRSFWCITCACSLHMPTQKEITRNLLLYEFRLEHDAQTAFANIIRTRNQQIVSKKTFFNCFKNFRAYNTDLNYKLREGRPREIDQFEKVWLNSLNQRKLSFGTVVSVCCRRSDKMLLILLEHILMSVFSCFC